MNFLRETFSDLFQLLTFQTGHVTPSMHQDSHDGQGGRQHKTVELSLLNPRFRCCEKKLMRASLAEIIGLLPGPSTVEWPEGEPFAAAIKHGSMLLEVFAPRGSDRQSPHSQDEIYIVVSGTAELDRAGERMPARVGDALFVAAGVEHKFYGMSDDFITWVVLWGPEGGEE
jgi:mannose-6-phosphate isomerase-like protein (cupin superfamily)